MFNKIMDFVFFGVILALIFSLGWFSGHSYGLVDNVSRCPPTYISKPCVCEVCPEPLTVIKTVYGGVCDCSIYCEPRVIDGLLVCERSLKSCLSGGECSSGVCVDGVCGEFSK